LSFRNDIDAAIVVVVVIVDIVGIVVGIATPGDEMSRRIWIYG